MSTPTATRELDLGINLERIYKEMRECADFSAPAANTQALVAYNKTAAMLNAYYTLIGDTRTALITNYANGAPATADAATISRMKLNLAHAIIYLTNVPGNWLGDRDNNFDAVPGAYTAAKALAIAAMASQLALL